MTAVRLNKFIASHSQLSRRAADDAIAEGRVHVNGQLAQAGQQVSEQDQVTLDGHQLSEPGHGSVSNQTILLNKPVGYVVSRNGQGSRTIFNLLPSALQHLQPVGRLDKNSSGLLLMTTDGDLAQQLTHPKYQKTKQYEIALSKPLTPLHRQMISDFGIQLADGHSQLQLERLRHGNDQEWLVTMHEGRNRQIRRTFRALGYDTTKLHRIVFGDFHLPDDLASGHYIAIK